MPRRCSHCPYDFLDLLICAGLGASVGISSFVLFQWLTGVL